MDKNQIFITSGTEYKRMTKELLEKANLQSHIGDRKKKIGIKPNLVSPSEASWGLCLCKDRYGLLQNRP